MKARQKPQCVLIKGTERYEGKQGPSYAAGVSAQSAGSRALCLHLITILPNTKAKAHKHENHESAVYVMSGEVECYWGERLEKKMVVHAGEFMYIPANMPHMPVNRSKTEPARAVLARTDPNEQESVVLLPELEKLVP